MCRKWENTSQILCPVDNVSWAPKNELVAPTTTTADPSKVTLEQTIENRLKRLFQRIRRLPKQMLCLLGLKMFYK